MIDMTRRQVIQGALLSGLAGALGQGGKADAQADPVIRSPYGAAETTPRLQGIRRVIIDTDPGNDDALALLLAMAAPHLQVDAVTVCPGNLGPEGYDQQVRNALYVVDLAGKSGKVPVYRGMEHPILNLPYPVATFIHGKYGMGDVQVPTVTQRPEAEHAVDAMRRMVNAAPGEITILALGGLTNIAMAMLRETEFASKLKGILFVGGRYATPGMAPSYNVLVDPEAAHVVFTSGVTLTMMSADVINRDSVMVDADFDHAASLHTPWSRFFIESNNLRRTYEKKYRGAAGSVNPDPMAVASAIDPSIGLKYMSVYMRIELRGEYTRGAVVYGDDIYSGHPIPPGNVDICVAADGDKFKRMVFDTLQRG
jgi:inosine-uridine nucleoside N-ribohydrolase